MMIPHPGSPEAQALQAASEAAANQLLEGLLARVEGRLGALGEAMRASDSQGIETHAGELHQALAQAMDGFTHAARQGDVPRMLRQRLVQAAAQVAAQREALGRATASLDRAIDVLMPRHAAAPHGYSAQGYASVPKGSGSIKA